MKTVQFFMPRINVLAFILPVKMETLWKAKSKLRSEEERDGF